ncbi:MAG: 6-phosphogluconolactonase [Pseudomonadota bacterium]
MNLITYPDRDLMFIDLANNLAGELNTALQHEDRVSFAVPGGSTPGPVFDALSAADVDWARVDVLLTDERQVPPDHARSNERLIRERLLVGRAAEANFLRLVPDEGEAEAVNALLEERLPIDLMLLGMGDDMHTASLFPRSPDLGAAMAPDAPPLMKVAASGDLEPRITLTGPVLSSAIVTHILITGEGKRAALERAGGANHMDSPIALVLDQADVHWAP